jgi:DHA2 family multidrug resistance protein-like MFS transporter
MTTDAVTDRRPAASGQLAGRREWLGLAVLALPALLVAMDLSVLYLAVPRLTADLRPAGTQLLWITDVYGFMLAGFLVPMGTLGDRIGRRRLLMIGATVFGAACVLAAYSTTATMLIAGRTVLGIAGATLAPSALALIGSMFQQPRQRTFAVGVWVTSLSAGGAVGPILGGLLLQFFWWGSAFLIGVPVMALLLATGRRLLPEHRGAGSGRLDLASVALSLATVLPFVYGLKQTAQHGPGWPALSIIIGLACGTVFVRRQRRLADPLFDVRLFRTPAFATALAVNTFGFFALMGAFFFTAQYLQLVLRLPPLRAGLWTVPSFGGFIAGSLLTPLIVRRIPAAWATVAGLVLAAVGFWTLTRIDDRSGLAVLVTGSVVLSVGLAAVFTLVTNAVIGSAPPARAGAASAMSETATELGGALGIAVLGSIGAAIYRHLVAGSIPPGVPAQAARSARDTLGGAVSASADLPRQLATTTLDSARAAFTDSLHVVAAVSAATVAALAILTAITLRHVHPDTAIPDTATTATATTATARPPDADVRTRKRSGMPLTPEGETR